MHREVSFKKIKLFIMLFILVFLVSCLTIPVEAKTKDDDKVISPKTALKVANEFLEKRSEKDSKWENSTAHDPILFLEPNGNPGVFLCNISKEKDQAGYILVGANKDRAPVVLLSTGENPLNNIDELKNKALKKNKVNKLGKHKLVYGGPFSLLVEFAIDKDKKVHYNLNGKYQEPTVKQPKISKAQKQNNQKNWQQIESSESISIMSIYEDKRLDVRKYDQSKSQDKSTGCGPAAGAMILNYWDENGYTNLQNDSDRTDGVNLMNHLFDDMNTSGTGTMYYDWTNGIEKHANTCNNYSFDSLTILWGNDPDDFYSRFKNYINAGQPLGLWFDLYAEPYSWHVVAGRGYFGDSTGRYYLVNTWGEEQAVNVDEANEYHMMPVYP